MGCTTESLTFIQKNYTKTNNPNKMNILYCTIELVLTIFAIDFVSGWIHWAEDTFGSASTPIYGKWIVEPNTLHHEQPAAFINKTWWQSSWDLTLVSGLIVLIFYLNGALTWHIVLFAFLGANANQLHKYAHMSSVNVPVVVRFFQQIGLFQKAKHHALHHQGLKNTAYCVITPYLNPLLDCFYFWRFLEKIMVPIFGAPRREDLKNK